MSTGGPSASALRAWVNFPVLAEPRPTVLLSGRIRVHHSGFRSVHAKLAYLRGAIRSDTELPAEIARQLIRPTVSARQDFLTVQAVRATEADFDTDRGPHSFPAFELDTDGTYRPLTVLDPRVGVWWPNATTVDPVAGGSAAIDADGVTLHVAVLGGVLTEFVSCIFHESSVAVVAEPVLHERPTDEPVDLIGINGVVVGELRQPLGPRVLVDATARPIAVTHRTDSA